MGKEEVNQIKKIFSELGINAEYFEHEPVITSHEAARTRGFSLHEGVKAIVFTNEEEFVVVDVPADKKVDVRKVCDFLGWVKSKTRMATHAEVLEVTGCEVGAVPPFGHRKSLRIFVDVGVFAHSENSFNIGLRTHSARVSSNDLRKVFERLGVRFGEFAQ